MCQSIVIVLTLLLLAQLCLAAEASDELAWPQTAAQSKPWTRWWWPGNSVDRTDLTRELEQMSAAGIGGVEITPIYGIQGQETREIDFLSPKWIGMLQHVAAESKRLGMNVDMATCTGWPFGGPMVTPAIADAVAARDDSGRLISKPSGMKVKRAAPGGAGWVLNPYSMQAIDIYLKSFDVLPRGIVRAQFHDSFEYAGNYSDELPARFKAQHGYDLADHAAELFGQGDPEVVARVKSDYRQTLADMHLTYMQAWAKWCREHGYLARNQAHGAPGNLLDLYGISDIPETEIFGSTPFAIPGFRRDPADTDGRNEPQPMLSQFASSAAHVMGRPLASCETLTWLREHFKVALSMCKPEIDQMFLSGINHLIYHGSCYSPDDAAWPGWLFYASSEINPQDTLWKNLPEMNRYVARCQSVLQAGSPDNDLLIYWPVFDIWHSSEKLDQRFTVHAARQWLDPTACAKTAGELTDRGYTFDFISDAQLLDTSNDRDGLKSPGGAAYRALVIPDARLMPVETLRKVIDLARGGATVIVHGELPRDVPGLANLDQRRAELKQLIDSLEFAVSGIGARVTIAGKGRIVVGETLDMILPLVKIRHESLASHGVGFIRRRHDLGHHYFIAALGTRRIDGWVPLSVPCESAALLDPLTGRTGVAATRKGPAGTELFVQLDPGESIIVRTFADRRITGPQWNYSKPAGEPVALAGTWKIDFIEGGPSLPSSITTEHLESWTALGDDAAKAFAGTARYRIEFDGPVQITGPCLLDLGDVRESAHVRLNAEDLGVAWALPMRVSIDSLLERGNVLEIDVTNLAANRLRDLDLRGVKWRIMKEINYVNIRYKPFDASGWELAPSGLLGPVRLVPVAPLTPE